MKIVTIDNGNTNPHVGIFENERLHEVMPLAHYSLSEADIILISNVGENLDFEAEIDFKEFRSEHTFLDMPVNYSLTLGDDRLYSAYYVFKKNNFNERALLIDAGTFMTIDLISKNGFEGGYIFPGLRVFLESYDNGSNLPTLPIKHVTEKHLPHTTDEAIYFASATYVKGILKDIIAKTSPDKIILTGGSLSIIEQYFIEINSKVPLEIDPHLIHYALNSIFLHYLPRDP